MKDTCAVIEVIRERMLESPPIRATKSRVVVKVGDTFSEIEARPGLKKSCQGDMPTHMIVLQPELIKGPFMYDCLVPMMYVGGRGVVIVGDDTPVEVLPGISCVAATFKWDPWDL